MSNSKLVSSPLVGHFRLSSKQYPISEEEKGEMQKISYVSVVGSLMYVIVALDQILLMLLVLSVDFSLILGRSFGLQ